MHFGTKHGGSESFITSSAPIWIRTSRWRLSWFPFQSPTFEWLHLKIVEWDVYTLPGRRSSCCSLLRGCNVWHSESYSSQKKKLAEASYQIPTTCPIFQESCWVTHALLFFVDECSQCFPFSAQVMSHLLSPLKMCFRIAQSSCVQT